MFDPRHQANQSRVRQAPIIIDRRPAGYIPRQQSISPRRDRPRLTPTQRLYNLFRPSDRRRVIIRETTVRRRRSERVERSPSPQPSRPVTVIHQETPLVRTRSHGMSPRMPAGGFVPLPDRITPPEPSPRGNGRRQGQGGTARPHIETRAPDDRPPSGTRFAEPGESRERIVPPQRRRSQSEEAEVIYNQPVRSRQPQDPAQALVEVTEKLRQAELKLRQAQHEIEILEHQLAERRADAAMVADLQRQLAICRREHTLIAQEQVVTERLRNAAAAEQARPQYLPQQPQGRPRRPTGNAPYQPQTPRTIPPETIGTAPQVIDRDPGGDAIQRAQSDYQQRSRGTGRGNRDSVRR